MCQDNLGLSINLDLFCLFGINRMFLKWIHSFLLRTYIKSYLIGSEQTLHTNKQIISSQITKFSSCDKSFRAITFFISIETWSITVTFETLNELSAKSKDLYEREGILLNQENQATRLSRRMLRMDCWTLLGSLLLQRPLHLPLPLLKLQRPQNYHMGKMKDELHPSLPAKKLLAWDLTQELVEPPLLELLLRATHYMDLVQQPQTFVDCIRQHNMPMWRGPLTLLMLLSLLQMI